MPHRMSEGIPFGFTSIAMVAFMRQQGVSLALIGTFIVCTVIVAFPSCKNGRSGRSVEKPATALDLRGGAWPAEANLERVLQRKREIPMKAVLLVLASTLLFAGSLAHADEATEQEVIKTILDGNAYAKKNLKDPDDTVSKDGSLEFWSSGGFLQQVNAGATPDEYESVNIDAKHIHVITLVPGKVAVAQFYSEGSMAPKNSAAVSNYRTRATQVFVKEDGKWKVRAAHWSPIASGSGTSQTAVN